MFQSIASIVIILSAISWVVFRLYSMIFKKQEVSGFHSCSHCTHGDNKAVSICKSENKM